MELVTVFQTFKPTEAQLARARLDAAGFPAQVMHELSALSIEGYSLAAGGILVQVPSEMAEDARLLLQAKDEPSE